MEALQDRHATEWRRGKGPAPNSGVVQRRKDYAVRPSKAQQSLLRTGKVRDLAGSALAGSCRNVRNLRYEVNMSSIPYTQGQVCGTRPRKKLAPDNEPPVGLLDRGFDIVGLGLHTLSQTLQREHSENQAGLEATAGIALSKRGLAGHPGSCQRVLA